LCIDKTASQEEIKVAFKKMEELFAHKEADEWAKTIYREAKLAYRILKDPITRREYGKLVDYLQMSS
jgi:DnaJ-class molecular chaperone